MLDILVVPSCFSSCFCSLSSTEPLGRCIPYVHLCVVLAAFFVIRKERTKMLKAKSFALVAMP